jgi:tRNA (adenine9-N1/guanine9-N1)-methyltransferase
VKTPRDFLADYLKSSGFSSIKSAEKNFNSLAVKIERGRLLVKEGKFSGKAVDSCGGITLITGSGTEFSGLHAGRSGERIHLGIELEYPKIVIDYGLWSYHTPKEKWLLKKQTLLSIQAVRRHLWDRNLVLARCPDEVKEAVNAVDFFGDILSRKYKDDAILLDPRAPLEISEFSSEGSYILGGIVDKSNQLRTRELGYDFPGRSIRVNASVSAVPDRINLLVNAICLNSLGVPLQKAIRP